MFNLKVSPSVIFGLIEIYYLITFTHVWKKKNTVISYQIWNTFDMALLNSHVQFFHIISFLSYSSLH